MTLWVRKFGLILGLPFLIFACEEPGEIGLELNPDNGAFVAKYSEIPIPSSIFQYKDIFSDNATRIDEFERPVYGGRWLVGAYMTQDFGKIESTAFIGFYLSGAGFKGENFIFDSLVLKIKVDYLYGTNFMGNKRFYVHELTEGIKSDSLYLTSNTTPYDPTPVGEFNIDISGFDTTKIDSVFSTRLSDDFGIKFLDEAKRDTMTYHDNVEFRKFFNGIALVPDNNDNVIIGVHAESESTYMRMYIHDTNDTTYFDFIVQGLDTGGINITRYYNHIDLDKTGAPIDVITDYHKGFETQNGKSYVQASAGIMTKLNITPYLNFTDTIEHLIINRAELEIPVVEYANFLEPSPAFNLYVGDQNNKFVEELDSASSKITYKTVGSVTFDKQSGVNKGIYNGNITTYIQDLTSGNSEDTVLIIGQTSLWNSVVSVNQGIIDKNNIKLKIYYSELK